MNPEISVIVPVHNAERFLRKCLDSAFAQTFEDFEIICADDASTDGSLAVLREYAAKDARMKVLSGTYDGPSATRNAALALATGDYIAFLDADDWWDPTALQKALARAKETGAQLVVFDYWLYREGQELSTYRDQDFFARYDGQVVNLATCPELAGFVGIWDRLFRRDVLVPHGFLNGLLYEDAAYCMEALLMCDKVAIIADHLYYYRRNVQASITYTEDASRKHEEDFLVAQGYMQQRMRNANISQDAWKSYAKYFAEYAYMHQREVAPRSRFFAFFEEIRRMACPPQGPQLFELWNDDDNPWRKAYLGFVRANSPQAAWLETQALNATARLMGRR